MAQTETPIMSPSGGSFNNDVIVTITCGTPSSTIYYKKQYQSYSTYTGPITLTMKPDSQPQYDIITAYATAAGLDDSAETQKQFFIELCDIGANPSSSAPDRTIYYNTPVDVSVSCNTTNSTTYWSYIESFVYLLGYEYSEPFDTDDASISPPDNNTLYFQAVSTAVSATTDVLEIEIIYLTIEAELSPDPGPVYNKPLEISIDSTIIDFADEIYYTDDGSEPTRPPTGSTVTYSGSFYINDDTTVKALAYKSGQVPDLSPVVTGTYTFIVDDPEFTPPAGTYDEVQYVVISTTTTGASIYYTIDGADPTPSDTLYTSSVTISGAGGKALKARGYLSGYADSAVVTGTYTLQVLPLSFDPVPGEFYDTQYVSLSSTTSGSSIYYTTDNTDPTESDTLYSSTITLSGTTILKAKGYKSGLDPSTTASGSYDFKVPDIDFDPSEGSYDEIQYIVLSTAVSGASIYYTTDGSEPTQSGTTYSGSILVDQPGDTIIKTRGYKTNFYPSNIGTSTYSLEVQPLSFNPDPAMYGVATDLYITTTTSGAAIYYSLDGSEPTQSSTLYTASINFSSTSEYTVQAKGYKSGLDPSTTISGDYTFIIRIGDGLPEIQNNKLFFDSRVYYDMPLNSNYELVGDFDVQVSGTHGSSFFVLGNNPSLEFYHGIRLVFPHDNDRWCEVAKLEGSVTRSRYLSEGGSVTTITNVPHVYDTNYMLRVKRVYDMVYFYYNTDMDNVTWQSLGSRQMYFRDCKLILGLYIDINNATVVDDVYFDDFEYASAKYIDADTALANYGVANMDNIRSNQSTFITIYDLAVYNNSLYRLQDEATYYGSDNDWGSNYSYQVTPLRTFVDFITVGADPQILPATGRNAALITAVVLDQYGEGIYYKPVEFTDDDTIGYITSSTVYTDNFYGTGEAKTSYMSGIALRIVTIEGTATQYD